MEIPFITWPIEHFPGFRDRFVEHSSEIQVKLEPFSGKDVGQEQFALESRRLNALLPEKFAAFLNGFENGHPVVD